MYTQIGYIIDDVPAPTPSSSRKLHCLRCALGSRNRDGRAQSSVERAVSRRSERRKPRPSSIRPSVHPSIRPSERGGRGGRGGRGQPGPVPRGTPRVGVDNAGGRKTPRLRSATARLPRTNIRAKCRRGDRRGTSERPCSGQRPASYQMTLRWEHGGTDGWGSGWGQTRSSPPSHDRHSDDSALKRFLFSHIHDGCLLSVSCPCARRHQGCCRFQVRNS